MRPLVATNLFPREVPMLRGILGLLSITSLLVTAAHVHAQGYRSGAVNLVIPLAPGDASDVAGRTMAEELSKLLKVPIVPVNKPGAGGTLGADSARHPLT
jgi:putative tricarboxylic transport membrane protein